MARRVLHDEAMSAPRRLRFVTSVLALSMSIGALACSSGAAGDDPTDGDEGALATKEYKTLARNLEHPAGLIATDKYVYLSSNHFVASGDPDLDQEMAYWEGKYSRFPVGGGAREAVDGDGLTHVRAAGKLLFGATGSSCWIASLDMSAAKPKSKSVYTDPDCSGEGGGEPAGFEIANDKLIVVRFGGEVVAGGLDGSNMKAIGKFKFGNYSGFIEWVAKSEDQILVVTHRNYTDEHNKVMPQTIFSMPISGGAPKVVHEFKQDEHDVSNFTSDGKNVYWSQDKTVYVLPPGATDPKKVADDFAAVTELAAAGDDVFVADGKRGNVYVVKNATTSPAKPAKLFEAKGVEALAIGNGKLYFATHAIDGKKAVGVLGAAELP